MAPSSTVEGENSMPSRKHTTKPRKVLSSPRKHQQADPKGGGASTAGDVLNRRTIRIRSMPDGKAERRARLQSALREAAALAIEGAVSRAAVLNEIDNALVQIAMGAFDNDDLHLAALLIDVPDEFVKTRWEGLRRFRGA
jgi:hypothetical protein